MKGKKVYSDESISLFWVKRASNRRYVLAFTGVSEHDDPGISLKSDSKAFKKVDANVIIMQYNCDTNTMGNRMKRLLHLPYNHHECPGLISAGNSFYQFVNQHLQPEECFVIGHSKGCFSAIAFLNQYSYAKHIYLASFPGEGSLATNKTETLKQATNWFEKFVYLASYNDHAVDKEISHPQVLQSLNLIIPKDYQDKITNVITHIVGNYHSFKLTDAVCSYIHKYKELGFNDPFPKDNDGIVTLYSQSTLPVMNKVEISCPHTKGISESVKLLLQDYPYLKQF